MSVPRPHIPLPTTPGLGTTVTVPKPPLSRVAPVTVPQTTIPSVSTPSARDVSLEITDTQEGRIAPICYGRVRFAPKLVHFDIVNLSIEMIVLIGEGEIDAVEAVYVDGTECYAAAQAWANVQVRTGTLTQTAVTNISNATISAMTHPGQAYVALQVSLLQAPLNGGIPQVEVAVRGLKVLMGGFGYNWATSVWSENPVDAVADLLMDADYGCDIASADLDLAGSIITSEGKCGAPIPYTNLVQAAQTASDSDAGFGDYDRLQSFVVPATARGLAITGRVTIRNNRSLLFPFVLRATPDGADILPDTAQAASYPGNGTYDVTSYFLGTQLVAGQTYYIVFKASTDMAWRLNTLTDGYASGKAQAKIGGVWTDVNYDHYFVAVKAEATYRASIVIDQRQPIEMVAKQILQTCHGRLAWWDGKYRVTLDGSASGSLVASDLQSPVPDVPILAGSLSLQRSDSEVPNTCSGEYLDTETWQRLPVKVESTAVQQGLEQPRVLDVGFVAVPSGGQLFRLLTTWLARSGRTWRAQCLIPQHGLRLAPGDTVVLTSRLFSISKTCIVDDIVDGAGGTFQLSLLEYAAGDFSAAAYIPQAAIATITNALINGIMSADDFTRGGITSGTIGELGWTLGGVAPTYTTAAGHPGIVTLPGGASTTTLSLPGSGQKWADNSVWSLRWILSPIAPVTAGWYVELLNQTFDVRFYSQATPPYLYVDGVNTGLTFALGDWLVIDSWCAGTGTAYLVITRNGQPWYSGSKAVSSSAVNRYLTVYGPYCAVNVDFARIQLGATR